MTTTNGAGSGSDRELADEELQRCRAGIAAGDLEHAAKHLGRALAHDPSLPAAYVCLTQVAEAAGSSPVARELFKGDGTSVESGNAAAIVALLAGEGKVSDAVDPKLAARARKALAGQYEAARAMDVDGLKESLLGRWKRRKER